MGLFDKAKKEFYKGYLKGISENNKYENSDYESIQKEADRLITLDNIHKEFEEAINNKPLTTQEQKEMLLKTGELIIYKEIYIVSKNKNHGEHTQPKGLTDIIGGVYGNTAIRTETTYTAPYSTKGTEWREHKLLLKADGFTIPSTSESMLYEEIDSVTIYEDTPSDMGLYVFVNSKKLNNTHLRNTIKFKTPMAKGFVAILKEKTNNKNTVDEHSTTNLKNSSSNADELMKYAELYEKGLLTEEEFNAMKKKLLGL